MRHRKDDLLRERERRDFLLNEDSLNWNGIVKGREEGTGGGGRRRVGGGGQSHTVYVTYDFIHHPLIKKEIFHTPQSLRWETRNFRNLLHDPSILTRIWQFFVMSLCNIRTEFYSVREVFIYVDNTWVLLIFNF